MELNCEDCKYRRKSILEKRYDTCTHPQTGEFASIERAWFGDCGEEGKFFEKRTGRVKFVWNEVLRISIFPLFIFSLLALMGIIHYVSR